MIKACCRRHPDIERYFQGAVHIRVENIRCIVENAVVADQLVEQIELAFHDAAQREQQEHHERCFQHRNRNVPDPLENVRAVDFGSLIILLADTRNRCQVDNHAVPDIFPQVEDDNEKDPNPRRIVYVNRFVSEGLQRRVQESALEVEHVVYDNAKNNEGNKVWKKHDRLRQLLEPLQAQLA